jgi:hypothetical protein
MLFGMVDIPRDDARIDQSGIEVQQPVCGRRENVPSALADPRHPSFAAPLIDLGELLSGGPPPDGIPSIDDPKWLAVGDVDWLEDREPVVFVEVEGEQRAYPVQILMWHELVNDTIAGRAITVSYCPLCNSAISFDRRAGGRTLDFGTSGMLYQSAMVMYDRQTESLWSHFIGRAIAGYLVGTQLDFIASPMISWGRFKEDHPDGRVLSKETGHVRDYGRNPYPGYDDVGSSPLLYRGPIDDRLLAKTRVSGLRGVTESVAIPIDRLAADGLAHVTLDGDPIVVFHSDGLASALDGAAVATGRDVGQTTAFRAMIDDERLTFRRTGAGWEDQDGTTWNLLGRAMTGPLAARQLTAVEHLDTFWFAWAAFMPETRILG